MHTQQPFLEQQEKSTMLACVRRIVLVCTFLCLRLGVEAVDQEYPTGNGGVIQYGMFEGAQVSAVGVCARF